MTLHTKSLPVATPSLLRHSVGAAAARMEAVPLMVGLAVVVVAALKGIRIPQ